MIEELLKLLFTNLRPLDIVTLAAIVAGFIWQVRRDRFKPKIDKADAADKISDSGIRLVDSAMSLRKISEDKAGELERENIELTARINAIDQAMLKQTRDFTIELARQKAQIVLLNARVTELEMVVRARDESISERDRIIAGLREQMSGLH